MMRNEGFASGMLTGLALGALMVMVVSPRIRRPMMAGMGEVGERVRGMVKQGARTAEQMMPGDEH